jgi:uncharacterized protein YeaO (DUF488 family)
LAGKKRHPNVRLKRAYDPASSEDGVRVLVDRLWPRGVRKSDAAIDLWLKEVAPSTELRQWFGHDPARWKGFCRKYKSELSKKTAELDELQKLAGKGRLTLIFSARDAVHNEAIVLKHILDRQSAAPVR